ncbi:hypothetical protein D7294_30525 [Streptomyces hoynatensis]|uniref:Zinc finger CHC2-type domain-containing protein n=1 Tax=Streptomyces hoynatensis TaxID=1141874 RepID=A0A3A9YFL9_9ACTN|nr:hypothetical protein D7294_30525 [Streptomyces hoynatensis]
MAPHGSRPGGLTASEPRILIPLEPILNHYGVELQGSRWGEQQCCCPIHGERRPSMRVNLEKGVFFCHSCGAGGTAVHLIMAMESVNREDALKRATRIFGDLGISVPAGSSGKYRRPGVLDEEGYRPRGRRYVPPGRR